MSPKWAKLKLTSGFHTAAVAYWNVTATTSKKVFGGRECGDI